MSEFSIFEDKAAMPSDKDLKEKLGPSYDLWNRVSNIVYKQYPDGKPEWNFPGKKYGWSFRIKDKKRAIIYLIPLEGYFKVAMVFGQKATDEIMGSTITDSIKTKLKNARKYAEGRGFRFEVHDESKFKDIEDLVAIKLKY